MSNGLIKRISGGGATYTVTGTSEVTKKFDGIYIAEDTVISSVKMGNVEVWPNYIDTTSATIKAGTFITCEDGRNFNKITLTSGSVTLTIVE